MLMDEYRALLSEFIAHKSISTDPVFIKDIEHTVEWLRELFEKSEFDVYVHTDDVHPIVVASYKVDSKAEACVVYGHYDVQPADKKNGWLADPFVLTEKDGKLYARGVVDNKGQVLIHIYSVLKLIEEKKLKYNVTFVIEGDEETGGMGVGELLRKEKDRFQADHVMISDGEMPYKPVLTASFRGTFNTTVTCTTAANNLHSGLYGGAVPNAAQELAKLVGELYGDEYLINVEGFYDDDDEIANDDMIRCKEMDATKKELFETLGVKKFFEKEGSFCADVGFVSMCTVSGFQSGYTATGYSNIIPCKAEARFNFRLAASQDPMKVYKLFRKFVEKRTPNYVEVEVSEPESIVEPVRVNLDSPMHKEVMTLLEKVYGEKVLVDFCGATIPVVADFQQVVGVDPLLVSLANDDCNMHGVNENFDIGLIQKGLEFSRAFFSSS